MTDRLDIRLVNDLSEIPRLAEAVDAFFDERGLPPALAFHFNLALDELLTNVFSYAFPEGGRHEVAVSLAVDDGFVVAELIDDGTPFDPLTDAKPPVLEGDIDERPIGGLGIHFVKSMMDSVRYERHDGRNRLTLTKRAAADDP
ncbi:ATP-binding protein [Azospirillum halopraeferens]|uniref:ATP-binding protein n=1 Tax=Azospirillum halopraeferens TaxID=34010 RepID=UPI000418D791|nr:ATP-binding protein [Azospirillum halopraeferens]